MGDVESSDVPQDGFSVIAYGRAMSSMRRTFARHGKWLLAAMVVTAIVVAVTGWWPIAVYSAINLVGLVLYLDGVSQRTAQGRLRHRWFPILAIVLLPVGIYGVLASGDTGPSEALRGDPDLRSGFGGSVGDPGGASGGTGTAG